jgi:hypothetical protein
VHEVALGERERAVIDVDDGIALQHIEPLIRFLMHVRQRPTADRDIVVQERVTARCLDRRGVNSVCGEFSELFIHFVPNSSPLTVWGSCAYDDQGDGAQTCYLSFLRKRLRDRPMLVNECLEELCRNAEAIAGRRLLRWQIVILQSRLKQPH